MGTEQSEQTLLIKLDHFWRAKQARVAQAAELWLIISDSVRIFQYFNNWCGGCICEPFGDYLSWKEPCISEIVVTVQSLNCPTLCDPKDCNMPGFTVLHYLLELAQMVRNLPGMWEPSFDSWVGKIPWRRKWQPTPIFLPGESHGQKSLAGYSLGSCKDLDTIEQLTLSLSMSIELVIPSNHLTLCHPLLLLPSKFTSFRVFSSELALRIRWPK